MPAIREEMRVSEKLSPTIIGPTLKTATEILDSAYSKRTREKQEVKRRGQPCCGELTVCSACDVIENLSKSDDIKNTITKTPCRVDTGIVKLQAAYEYRVRLSHGPRELPNGY